MVKNELSSLKNPISTTKWSIKGLEFASTTFNADFLFFVDVATLALELALFGIVYFCTILLVLLAKT